MSKTATYLGTKMPTELVELLTLAVEQGFEVKPSSPGRRQAGVAVYAPDKTVRPITFGVAEVTPAHINNVRSSLVRAGLALHPEVIDLTTPEEIPVTKALPTYRDILMDPSIVKGLKEQDLEQILKNTDKDSFEYKIGNIVHVHQEVLDLAMRRLATDLVQVVTAPVDIDKTETQLLETMTELDTANKRIAKLEEQVSSLGTENKTLLEKWSVENERARKAEAKLTAFRTALAED